MLITNAMTEIEVKTNSLNRHIYYSNRRIIIIVVVDSKSPINRCTAVDNEQVL